MPCTTILVGKKASYDGSTMIARNDDGFFDVKKLVVQQWGCNKQSFNSPRRSPQRVALQNKIYIIIHC